MRTKEQRNTSSPAICFNVSWKTRYKGSQIRCVNFINGEDNYGLLKGNWFFSSSTLRNDSCRSLCRGNERHKGPRAQRYHSLKMQQQILYGFLPSKMQFREAPFPTDSLFLNLHYVTSLPRTNAVSLFPTTSEWVSLAWLPDFLHPWKLSLRHSLACPPSPAHLSLESRHLSSFWPTHILRILQGERQ